MMEGGCPLISLCGVAKWAPLEHAAAGAIEPNSRKGETEERSSDSNWTERFEEGTTTL